MATKKPAAAATVCNVNLSATLKKAYAVLDDMYTGDIKIPELQKEIDTAVGQVKRDLNNLATQAEKSAKGADGGMPQQIKMAQTMSNLNRYRNIVEMVGAATEEHTSLQGFFETARRINARVDDHYKRLQARQDALVREGFEGQMIGDGTHTPNNIVQEAGELYEDARAGGDKLMLRLRKDGLTDPDAELYSAIVNGHHKSNKILNVIGKAMKPGQINLKQVAQEAVPGNDRTIRKGLNVGVDADRLERWGVDNFRQHMWKERRNWNMEDSKLKGEATQAAIDKFTPAEWATMNKGRRIDATKNQYIKLAYMDLMKPRGAFKAEVDLPMVFKKGAERAEWETIQKLSQLGDNMIVDITRQHNAHLKKTAMEAVYGTDATQGHGYQQRALAAMAKKKGFKKKAVDELLRYDNQRHDLLKPLQNSVTSSINRVGSVLNNMASAGYLGKVAAKRWVVDGMIIPALHRLAYTNSPIRAAQAAIQGAISSFASIGQAALRKDAYKTLEFELETAGLRIRLSNNAVSQHLDEFSKLSTKSDSIVERGADTAAQLVSRFTGADAQYMGHTVDAVVTLGRDILWMKDRAFNKLPGFASYYFKRNGIGAKEWELLKKLPTMRAPVFNVNNKGRAVDVMPDFRAIRQLKAEELSVFQRKGESVANTRTRLENDYMAAFEDALYERFARPTQQDRIGGRPTQGVSSQVMQHLYRFMPIANKQWRGWNRAVRAMAGADPADSSVRGFFELAATSPKAWAVGAPTLAVAASGGMFIEYMEDLIAGNVPDKDYFTNPERWAHAIMQTGYIYPLTALATTMTFNSGKIQPSVPSLGVATSIMSPAVYAFKQGVRKVKGKDYSEDAEQTLKKRTFKAAQYLFPYSRMWFFQGMMNSFQREQFGMSDWEKRMMKEDRVKPWEKTAAGQRLMEELDGKPSGSRRRL